MTENSKNEKMWYKRPVIWGQRVLLFFLLLFAIGFVAAMFFDTALEWMGRRLGLDGIKEKNDILSFLGIAMGGILIALQALAAYRRAKAMEDAASAQADAAKAQAAASEAHAQANQYTEHGQRQERLKNAIEHLGHDSGFVRLGGAYELFHLAEDTQELRQTILEILCVHIRRTTSEGAYRNNHSSKPSEEIQSLLTLLFIKDHKVFSGCYINLQGSWLNGANLQGARLMNAYLHSVHLKKTSLANAKMQSANLDNAKLINADLNWARMQRANLNNADLTGADLMGTKMQVANLVYAKLIDTDLCWTEMQAAYLFETQMQGAFFDKVQMQAVNSLGWEFSFHSDKPFHSIIKEGINMESNLIGMHFIDKNNDQENKLTIDDMLAMGNIIMEEDIIIEPYTEEEAEKWIAEYDEAMADFSMVSG